ncbi:MAG TPA: tryptophan halogenase family protein [Rhizomicrobium sp.]|nr:tryptophan halogenase family protein [Rhizomicrobium sp.]
MSGLPSIAIVGGGLAGWIAAAALASEFKHHAGKVSVVECGQDEPFDLSEEALPATRLFLGKLSIDEDEFVRQTKATFKLGTEFAGWPAPESAFFHPFSQFGTSIETLGFHQCWFKLRRHGAAVPLGEYSLAAVAASLGRFARPVADTSSVFSSFSYGFHPDRALHRAFLRRQALARGVHAGARQLVDVTVRENGNGIDALVLEGGERLSADLYIDCSGGAGLLIERALKTGYEDWSRFLPCDRMIAWSSSKTDAPMPFSRKTAHEAGWQWSVPMRHQTGNGFVYSSQFLDDADVPIEDSDPRSYAFVNGRRRKMWNGNCVALGASAGFLEPLEATDTYLAQSGISRLLKLLPGSGLCQANAEEYNRLAVIEIEQIRDFLILHYCSSARHGSPFWDHCREMELPGSLAAKIEVFKSRGRIMPYGGEAFSLPNWLSVFAGMDVLPRRHHPFADKLGIAELTQRAEAIRAAIRQAANAMPDHRTFLARMGAI